MKMEICMTGLETRKRNGQGTLTLKNGDISHKGEWKDGMPLD